MTLRGRVAGALILGLLSLSVAAGCSTTTAMPSSESEQLSQRLDSLEAQVVKSQAGLQALQERLDGIVHAGWLNSAFESEAAGTGVPADLLKAISYVETRWHHHGSSPSIDGAYGLMGLRKTTTLPKAAQLLGVGTETLTTNPIENIRGGAVVLRSLYREDFPEGEVSQNLEDWREVVGRYSGLDEELLRKDYTDQVFQVLVRGAKATVYGEEISIEPRK